MNRHQWHWMLIWKWICNDFGRFRNWADKLVDFWTVVDMDNQQQVREINKFDGHGIIGRVSANVCVAKQWNIIFPFIRKVMNHTKTRFFRTNLIFVAISFWKSVPGGHVQRLPGNNVYISAEISDAWEVGYKHFDLYKFKLYFEWTFFYLYI